LVSGNVLVFLQSGDYVHQGLPKSIYCSLLTVYSLGRALFKRDSSRKGLFLFAGEYFINIFMDMFDE